MQQHETGPTGMLLAPSHAPGRTGCSPHLLPPMQQRRAMQGRRQVPQPLGAAPQALPDPCTFLGLPGAGQSLRMQQEQRHGEEDGTALLWLLEVSACTRQEDAIFRSYLQAGLGQQAPEAGPGCDSATVPCSTPGSVHWSQEQPRDELCRGKENTNPLQLEPGAAGSQAPATGHAGEPVCRVGSLGQSGSSGSTSPALPRRQELASSGKIEMERLL